jgi:hypothetical protein
MFQGNFKDKSHDNSRRFWKNKNVFLPNFPKRKVHNDFSANHI